MAKAMFMTLNESLILKRDTLSYSARLHRDAQKRQIILLTLQTERLFKTKMRSILAIVY